MRVRTIIAAALAAALAPAAQAKELQAVTLCGPQACRTFDDPATLSDFPTGGETSKLLGPPAPYYGLTFSHDGGHESFGMYSVPSANALVAYDESGVPRFLPIFGPTATQLVRRMTRGLEPFTPPRVTSVKVGERMVTGEAAETYLALFALKPKPEETVWSVEWVPIDFRSKAPSPWTDARYELMYSREENKLLRGWEVVPLDDRTAENLEAARALDRRSTRTPVWTVAFAALGALSLAALTQRRRLREPRQPRAAEEPRGDE